jgi:hypothetical protein
MLACMCHAPIEASEPHGSLVLHVLVCVMYHQKLVSHMAALCCMCSFSRPVVAKAKACVNAAYEVGLQQGLLQERQVEGS